MIKEIIIKNIASYDKEGIELNPKSVNFIYGNNGSGKTTITRVVENPELSVDSSVVWEHNKPIEVLSYNQDFVKANFNSETTIRGIFTLGEDSEKIYKEIEKIKSNIATIEIESESLKKSNIEDNIQLDDKKTDISKKLWNKCKKEYGEKTPQLFVGYNSSTQKFSEKIFKTEYQDNVEKYEDIIKEYELLYSNADEHRDVISLIDYSSLKNITDDKIFKTEIIENKDVTLSKLINDMGNSSWIEQGLVFLPKAHGKCPFCQQDITNDFLKNINNLYDKKYKEDKQNFLIKLNQYLEIKDNINEFVAQNISIISDKNILKKVKDQFDLLDSEFDKKKDDLKYICKCNFDYKIIDYINGEISKYNCESKIINDKIDNADKEKPLLVSKAWDYLRHISQDDISDYLLSTEKIKQNLKENETKIYNNKLELTKLNDKKDELESSISGISKTIVKINEMLKAFNFNNFMLKENDDHKTYSIIRPNGDDASKTLSEGEFSLISFLYFYFLVFGSKTRKGLDTEHVLLIDDPVTSMDSNILFIVSTLIRELIDNCVENKRNIKQIFISSHNVYFFKEVSYGYSKKSEFNFYTLNKINGVSKITDDLNNNPIKNSYELLWKRLREKNYSDDSNLNNMRRILEQYFISMGKPSGNNEELLNKFDLNDRIIVKSLLSYVNGGSHTIMDGLYMASDVNLNERAFMIFEKIFVETGNIEHYKMMMEEK